MILRILEVDVCGPHSLRLSFNDGTYKRVNVLPLLDGPVFEPLHNPAYFAKASLDPVAGSVVWPNEADFAPEALYELDAEEEQSMIEHRREALAKEIEAAQDEFKHGNARPTTPKELMKEILS